MPGNRNQQNNSALLKGAALYKKRARITLPWLVRQAKTGRTIFYSDLAKRIQIKNARNLNYILGAIGKALKELGSETGRDIPPIQCIVVNKQDLLPGAGIGWLKTDIQFSKLNKKEKQLMLSIYLAEIFAFPDWDWVLGELELKPITNDIERELESAKHFKGGGESVHHLRLKKFIATHPNVVGIDSDTSDGLIEYPLPSCDSVDILFTIGNLKVGVEVKSAISDTADILRGLFQCVKYKSLIEAEQIVLGDNRNCEVLLAIEGKMPKKLEKIRDQLSIKVIDNISII